MQISSAAGRRAEAISSHCSTGSVPGHFRVAREERAKRHSPPSSGSAPAPTFAIPWPGEEARMPWKYNLTLYVPPWGFSRHKRWRRGRERERAVGLHLCISCKYRSPECQGPEIALVSLLFGSYGRFARVGEKGSVNGPRLCRETISSTTSCASAPEDVCCVGCSADSSEGSMSNRRPYLCT